MTPRKPIIVTNIDEEALRVFVEGCEGVIPGKITMRQQWELTTDDPAVENALRAIFEVPRVSLPKAEKATAQARGQAAKLTLRKPKDSPLNKGFIKAWEIFEKGCDGVLERITTTELNKRIQNGTLPMGAYLHHPKDGWREVVSATAPQTLAVLDVAPIKLGQAEG